ncbi:toprim domain-containing protein, partial [Flavobacterium psychrophilum]|nr:toprim domain-containing protein [Flavobacterium psychrophilum]
MEITQIKSQLSMSTVLHYYGLKTDKHSKLNCPFHEDKTPSMQVYYKTQTAYCFSSNCKTHGKSIDVIDFILHKENCTKHEAINKAVEILGRNEPNKNDRYQTNLSREQFLGNMYQYFKNAVHSSKPAKEYLQSRNLDFKKIEVGYNGGQFHHGTRKDENVIAQCLEYGLLIDKNILGRTGEKAYNVFGKWGIVFALKNRNNEVTGLYFRSTLNEKESKHFYLKNRAGIYPNYPKLTTKKLILTESIIDCASLLQIDEVVNNYSVLACYGTNGLNEEIQNAIKELQQLEEIIFCFDNDDAGKEAVNKYGALFMSEYKNIKITALKLPNKDINETLQLHENEIVTELLAQRKSFLFSSEEPIGNILKDEQEEKEKGKNQKAKEENQNLPKSDKSTGTNNAIEFLKTKELLKRLNEQIGKSGIVGEENSRLLLFLIIISYMNKSPIHGIVQGSSGSGKTHIIGSIADLMPGEDVLRFTRITESSLYNWGEFDLFRKIIIIEDLDGLKEEALYALRELISNQFLSSSVSMKDKKGNNKSTRKEVKGQFSSLSATTKGETYEDNMSRSFLIAVDESKEQTQRIITHQNKRNAGEIDPKEKQIAVNFIQSLVRNLKYYEVINPFATKLQLPEKVHKIRRLNEMYQAVIKQVTFLNQYQREQTADGKLITTIEDIEQATEILFESIVLKVDELDGSLRQFFEKVKKHLKEKNQEFTQREIRQEFNISKSQCSRFIIQLVELEYITLKYGGNLKLQKYVIDYWDNYG